MGFALEVSLLVSWWSLILPWFYGYDKLHLGSFFSLVIPELTWSIAKPCFPHTVDPTPALKAAPWNVFGGGASASAPVGSGRETGCLQKGVSRNVCTSYLSTFSCVKESSSRSVEINSCSKDIAAFSKPRLLTQVPALDTDPLEATFSMRFCREPCMVKP